MYLPKEFDLLLQFCKNRIETVFIESLQSVKKDIYDEWHSAWTDFCSELAHKSCKPEYVEISLLRHSLLNDEDIPVFLFEAFNERWLFGGLAHTKKISLPTLAYILVAFRKDVYNEAKRYIGKIIRPLAKKAFLLQLPDLETHIADLLRANTDTWLLTPDFYTLFNQDFQCSFGGYRFFQYTLYEEG
jgi:hypothetical protein